MLFIDCWLISLNDIKCIYIVFFMYKNYKRNLNYLDFLFVDGFYDGI